METIYIILGLIMLVFGILQIILFFKLWKMTNDVHAIKENKPVDKNTPEDTFWELRKYILLNNVEKAEEIVLAIFLNNVRKDIAANGITGCNVEKWKSETDEIQPSGCGHLGPWCCRNVLVCVFILVHGFYFFFDFTLIALPGSRRRFLCSRKAASFIRAPFIR